MRSGEEALTWEVGKRERKWGGGFNLVMRGKSSVLGMSYGKGVLFIAEV